MLTVTLKLLTNYLASLEFSFNGFAILSYFIFTLLLLLIWCACSDRFECLFPTVECVFWLANLYFSFLRLFSYILESKAVILLSLLTELSKFRAVVFEKAANTRFYFLFQKIFALLCYRKPLEVIKITINLPIQNKLHSVF